MAGWLRVLSFVATPCEFHILAVGPWAVYLIPLSLGFLSHYTGILTGEVSGTDPGHCECSINNKYYFLGENEILSWRLQWFPSLHLPPPCPSLEIQMAGIGWTSQHTVSKMDPTTSPFSPCLSSTPCLDGQQFCHLNCSSQKPTWVSPELCLLSHIQRTTQLSVFTLESSQPVSFSAASLPLSRGLDIACLMIKVFFKWSAYICCCSQRERSSKGSPIWVFIEPPGILKKMQGISCPPRTYNLVWDMEQTHVKVQQLWKAGMKLCCQLPSTWYGCLSSCSLAL